MSGPESLLPPGLSGERLFASLLRSSAEGVIISRLEDALILEVSEAFVELTGYVRDELIGRPSTDLQLIAPAERERAIAEIRERGWVRDVETELRTKEGEIRSVLFSSEILRDEDKAYLLTVLRDVTERKRAEEELRHAHDRFQQLFESSPVPTAITRLSDGLIVLANPACLEILGWDAQDFVGHTIAEVNFWAHPERRQPMIDELRAHGRVRDYEAEIRTKIGETKDVLASIELLELDGDQCLVGLFYDITERKRAEEAVRDSEERYRLLAENATDMISRHHPDGEILYVSPACRSLLGYEPEEMVGQPGLGFMHPEDRSDPQVRVAYALAGPAAMQTIRFRHLHKDGTYVWVESTVRGIFDPATGALVEFQAATRDVSERVRAEEELRRAKEEAERANEAKSRFLSHMSHELRTPLAAILGFAELLQTADDVDSEKARQWTGYIIQGGQHLLDLVNELLEISRIEAGKMALVLEDVQIRGVLAHVNALVQPLAAERGVEIEYDDAVDASVFADALRLKQVLLNLASNAIKYNRPNGRVTVSATETVHGTVRIAIADTGVGMAPEVLERLFQPFERLGAEAGPVEGSGLGLVVAKGLVEALAGTLEVESEVGVGTTFTLELPAKAPEPVREQPAVAPTEVEALATPGDVLYIEDNPVNLELVEAILSELRPEVELRVATAGAEGILLAEKRRPDVLLLDLNLPDMPGEQVMRRLRADPRTADVPVLILSADSTSRNVTRLLETGADAYLTKPLDVTQFVNVLDRLLGVR